MVAVEEFVKKLVDLQYQMNCSRAYWELHPHTLQLRLSPNLPDQICRNKKNILKYISEEGNCEKLVSYLTTRTIQVIYHLNQFINLSIFDKAALHQEYSLFINQLYNLLSQSNQVTKLKDELHRILSEHSSRLRSYLQQIQDREIIPDDPQQLIVCSQYSPEFQLQMLGIDLTELWEPVLDIGCGTSGNLVTYLRNQGFQAYGIDRNIEKADSYLKEADWLELTDILQYGRSGWGTIISHMAFTNHFIHHHMRIDGVPEKYAKAYMSFLLSLRKGGSFFYAPGLPFIEDLLSEQQYEVKRKSIKTHTLYSTQIIKLH
ncbi:methyltransferase domain-containing protein [Brevibacillus migulae]|uniref:class I SAM-dependent methyltransferase n=1 Tax=Brevibacillus migulae TaxID=1644114 RepID=UPI00106EBC37|nr:class I SAM-dependent methyltransferase [Brevibacillus migulae]